jgi:hypothetical protein
MLLNVFFVILFESFETELIMYLFYEYIVGTPSLLATHLSIIYKTEYHI